MLSFCALSSLNPGTKVSVQKCSFQLKRQTHNQATAPDLATQNFSHKKAFMFDANGVLYYRKTKRVQVLEDFLRKRKVKRIFTPLFRRKSLERLTAIRRCAETGTATLDEYYSKLLDVYRVADPGVRQDAVKALSAADEDVTLFDEVKHTLNELQSSGFKLAIITNAMASTDLKLRWLNRSGLPCALKFPKSAVEWTLPQTSSISEILFWDAVVNSCEVGAKKPDPKIFLAALDQLQISPKDGVFVGHEQAELDGAAKVGITPIGFNVDAGVEGHETIPAFGSLLALTKSSK